MLGTSREAPVFAIPRKWPSFYLHWFGQWHWLLLSQSLSVQSYGGDVVVGLTTHLAADWFAVPSLTFEQLYLLYVYTDIFPFIEMFKPQFHSAKREKALQRRAIVLTRPRKI